MPRVHFCRTFTGLYSIMCMKSPAVAIHSSIRMQYNLKRHVCDTAPQARKLKVHASIRKGRTVSVVAFKGGHDDVIAIPLNYYKVLTVSKASSPAMIRMAYDRQLRSPPDVGFSQDTLFYRAVLLRDAAECLQNFSSRRVYDAMAQESTGCSVDVSPENLPAALVLLQEAGDSQLVIDIGSEWLQQHGANPFARDVAAAVALAHCDEAAEALEQNSNTVLRACQNLEISLQLLRKHRMAPQLQQQIMQTLEDYSPRYCLELLALPLESSFIKQRQRGTTLLRKLAFDLPQDLSPVNRQEKSSFLSAAAGFLTPQELLDFYNALPAGTRLDHQQKLQVAQATVAVGYMQQQPHTVQQAARAFERLQQETTNGGQVHDVSLERAGCALMLGDTDQAQELLGLPSTISIPQETPGTREEDMQADDSVRAFVLEHSPDPADLLPGLYVLTESWLQEAVMARFRQDKQDTQEPVSLRVWFESKPVQWYIQVCAMLRSISILRLLQAASTVLVSMVSWVVRRMRTVTTTSKPSNAPYSSTAVMETNSALCQSSGRQQQNIDQLQSQARATQHKDMLQLPAADQSTLQAVDDQDQQPLLEQEINLRWMRQQSRSNEYAASKQSADDDGAHAEQMKQLQSLEAAMWDSEPVMHKGWFLMSKALAVVLVASAVASAYLLRGNGTMAPAAARSAEIWRLSKST